LICPIAPGPHRIAILVAAHAKEFVLDTAPFQDQKKSPLKNPYLYSGIVLLAVAAYVGFVVISRYESNRAYDRRNAEKAAEAQRANDRAVVEQLGGTDLAIRALYVSPTEIHSGDKAQLCYDVANAKTVTLDPAAGEVWPSHNRCLDISPKKTTTYTLTIADAAGHSTNQTVELKVH
jgi:hypothetical protein